jgi:hypothetical protein
MKVQELNDILDKQEKATRHYQDKFFLSPDSFNDLINDIHFTYYSHDHHLFNSTYFKFAARHGYVDIYKMVEEFHYRIWVSDTQYFDLKFNQKYSIDQVATEIAYYRSTNKKKLNDGNYWIPGGIIRIEEL